MGLVVCSRGSLAFCTLQLVYLNVVLLPSVGGGSWAVEEGFRFLATFFVIFFLSATCLLAGMH